MRNIKFEIGEYYHIYNRGVDKRKVFINENDYQRFLDSIKNFNNESTHAQRDYKKRMRSKLSFEYSKLSFRSIPQLTEFICYCLNPNHYHFLLKQIREGGIEKFMHKLGLGYSKYFNKKYNRSGSLFEGTYKAVHIQDNSGFTWLSAYVNGNPEIHQIAKADNYQWSSYPCYLNKRKRDICNKEDILGQFSSIDEYKDFVNIVILEAMAKKEAMKNYVLE